MGAMDARTVLRWTGSLVGLAGVAFSLTLLYKSMRSVQAIGGFCASGGPYQIAHTCPKGVAGLLPLAIVGGLIVSQVLTLYTTPVIYLYMDRLNSWISKFGFAKSPTAGTGSTSEPATS